jgi:hypothetical protein
MPIVYVRLSDLIPARSAAKIRGPGAVTSSTSLITQICPSLGYATLLLGCVVPGRYDLLNFGGVVMVSNVG